MDLFVELASSLLSFARQVFGPDICPGGWVWATTTAGALIALVPVVGALLVALIRKGTGNTYNGATIGVFGTIGVLSAFVVPLVLMLGISGLFQAAFAGETKGVLTGGQAESLFTTVCGLVGDQGVYLGGGENVFETIFYPGGNKLAYGFYLGALIGLPLLSLVFVMLQGKIAFRRGPKWPGRLFWVPFLLLVFATVGLTANTAVHLWLGFLPISVLGLAPIAIVGGPGWKALRRSEQPKEKPAVPPYAPPYVPVSSAIPATPPPPPAKEYPPTALAPVEGEQVQPLAAVPGPIPSATVGPGGESRYRRVRKLGQGGFGTVWESMDTQLNRKVALKIAHAPSAEVEERMQREARALAALNHPNCVRVYDLVEESDGLALVMEYLDGQALAFAVDSFGPVDDVAAARLWSTMASALLAAHDKGVLHRDVKPSNIIVDPKGLPHLIDFGIARSRGDSSMTATGMMIGTPDYTAPETANGAPASPASDAWQLAATVSFALSGNPPRGVRDNPMASLMAAARAEALTELPKNSVHGRLLSASLDAEPRNRPTLRAVVAEMNSWLAGAGETAAGPVTKAIPRGGMR